MRYYDLVLRNAAGKIYQPTSNGNGFALVTSGSTFTSQIPNPNGGGGTINNPGALNVEFDVVGSPFSAPQGNSHIKIWGVGLHMIGQARQLAGASFALSAGMKPGLPLATAQAPQAGLIAQGCLTRFRAFPRPRPLEDPDIPASFSKEMGPGALAQLVERLHGMQ